MQRGDKQEVSGVLGWAGISLGSQQHGALVLRQGTVGCHGGLPWMDPGLREGEARTARRESCPWCERATGVHGAGPWDR